MRIWKGRGLRVNLEELEIWSIPEEKGEEKKWAGLLRGDQKKNGPLGNIRKVELRFLVCQMGMGQRK